MSEDKPVGGRQTVLVTGGCGYVGSQLIRDLSTQAQPRPVTIRVLDNLQVGRPEALAELPGEADFEFIEGDVLDRATLKMALTGIDSVVHLAAIVRTPMSFDNPGWIEQVNHWGTANLVEACLDGGVSRIVFASSGAVYGPGGPFSEADACQPLGPYGGSKLRAEAAVLAGSRRGLEAVVLRLGLVCGPAPVTRFDNVANRFALLAGTGRPLTVYGEGRQRRSFIDVRDGSGAICWALSAELGAASGVFNAAHESLSVNHLAEIMQIESPRSRIQYTEQDIRAHLSQELDCTAIHRVGWKPRWSVAEGLHDLTARFTGVLPLTYGDPDMEDMG